MAICARVVEAGQATTVLQIQGTFFPHGAYRRLIAIGASQAGQSTLVWLGTYARASAVIFAIKCVLVDHANHCCRGRSTYASPLSSANLLSLPWKHAAAASHCMLQNQNRQSMLQLLGIAVFPISRLCPGLWCQILSSCAARLWPTTLAWLANHCFPC